MLPILAGGRSVEQTFPDRPRHRTYGGGLLCVRLARHISKAALAARIADRIAACLRGNSCRRARTNHVTPSAAATGNSGCARCGGCCSDWRSAALSPPAATAEKPARSRQGFLFACARRAGDDCQTARAHWCVVWRARHSGRAIGIHPPQAARLRCQAACAGYLGFRCFAVTSLHYGLWHRKSVEFLGQERRHSNNRQVGRRHRQHDGDCRLQLPNAQQQAGGENLRAWQGQGHRHFCVQLEERSYSQRRKRLEQAYSGKVASSPPRCGLRTFWHGAGPQCRSLSS